MDQLRKLLALPLADLFELGKMALLLLVIRLGLSFFSFQTVRQILAKVTPTRKQVERDNELARSVWAAQVMGRHILGDRSCLPQALVVQMIYRQRGYPAKLQIGVTKDGKGQLLAHAWVESKGSIVIGGVHSPKRFTPLPSIEQIHR